MAKFVCFGDDCPNNDVVYDFGDDNPASCECGGCHVMLTPVEESADE